LGTESSLEKRLDQQVGRADIGVTGFELKPMTRPTRTSTRGTPAVDRMLQRLRRSTRDESGFTLIESVLAVVLFMMIASALATVLVASINSHSLSRHKTIAQQAAQDQLEYVRNLAYDDVGTQGGNPPGQVPAVQNVTRDGLTLTVRTQISYVADPTPTSYATSANYKKVVVTVTRTSDGKQLTREVTYVAPPARAPLGGINEAIVTVQVVDAALNTGVPDATVSLGTGPSAPRSDTTDASGHITFAALTANPTSGSQAYYDLTASLSGYVTLADDVPPAAAAHVQLAPGQTFNTAIRIYKPATIYVFLDNADGSSYPGDATITVSSARGSEVLSYTGSSLTITTVNGEPVVPGIEYTVSAVTSGGLPADPVTQYVPDDYPTDLTSTFTVSLPPLAPLAVTVMQGGSPVVGAFVTATGGPYSISFSGTTDANGLVTFDVPIGTGYTVTSSTTSATVDVPDAGGASVTLDLPPPGTVVATVLWAGSPVNGASVTLSGGPESISVTGTSDSSGEVTFVNIPPGSGYTVTVTSPASGSQTGVTVVSGGTANVTVDLPTGSLVVTVNSGGQNQSDATVTLSGGPMGITVSGTTDGSGQVTFLNVPTGSGYTITASKGGASVSQGKTIVAGSNTATLTLPSLVVTVNSGGQNQPDATVTLTGGPAALNVSGTTNASGQVTFLNVPVGSGYTITASKNGASVSQSKTIAAGSNTATLTLPSLTVTVRRSGVNQSSATVYLLGGPLGLQVTGTTNGSGQVTFLNVPQGSGYTVKAWKCSVSSPKSVTSSSFTIAAGSNSLTVSFSTSTCPLPIP
jgi:type II secretory pathway pseudopilin PulG